MRRKLLAFGDVHIPHQNQRAVSLFIKVAARIKPDLLICLGDLLNCEQFSHHPPTYGVAETTYEDDLNAAKSLLDRLQQTCGYVAMVEGNHEYRLDRWAGATAEGRGAYSMLAPRIQLSKDSEGEPRKRFTYIPYGSADGRYPHYRINGRLIAVHGWTYDRHATKKHLDLSQGRGIIHGHTHRADASIVQNIWHPSQIIEARSAGCLCQPIPLYGTGRPVEWVNAFIIGYLGRRSDTLYTIPIMEDRCILPDGTEVRA